jgi:hypothetical protein
VAALDSGRNDEAIIAFERVLASSRTTPARRWTSPAPITPRVRSTWPRPRSSSFAASNPPPAAQQAIGRYLEAIETRKSRPRRAGPAYGELGLGYDSNITGVPTDFGAAGAAVLRPRGARAHRQLGQAQRRLRERRPGCGVFQAALAGWSVFGSGDVKGRAYQDESKFNSAAAEVRFGGRAQQRAEPVDGAAQYLLFNQEGDAPGDPKPTNDRRMGGLGLDWRHALDTKRQLGLSLQANAVRFPTNAIEDFDQVFVSASWLQSFERPGVPLLYLTAFGSHDQAKNKFADGVTTKSKDLAGLRSYFQYSVTPKVQLFTAWR